MITYSIRNTYTKIGTIQRRLAWPLRKDDTQNREAFRIFWELKHLEKIIWLDSWRKHYFIFKMILYGNLSWSLLANLNLQLG